MERHLTKSRFKLACECETKLYYTRKKDYADQSAIDPFLRELAKGGYQVGELARYFFSDVNLAPIVIETGYDEALNKTRELIERKVSRIAEAAVKYGNLFIRADLFHIDVDRKHINFYEVKSKSYSSSEEFYTYKRNTDEITGLKSEWKSYLYDVAFQKYVITNAYPGYKVNAFLTLVNKDAKATVEGLNQFFKVQKSGNSYEVIVTPGLTKDQLGKSVLIDIPVDDVIDYILNSKSESKAYPGYNFADYINVLSEAYRKDEKIPAPISKECKKCSFYTTPEDEKNNLKSGMRECWMEKIKISGEKFNSPKVTEIFGLYAPKLLESLIEKQKYFIVDVEESDIFTKPDNSTQGLSWTGRRWEQISRVIKGDQNFFLDKQGLREEMNSWKWPLHFIDFETSMPAIPFTRNARPYEGIAFQYSHHIVSKQNGGDYRIIHQNQFIKTDRGINPNLDFIRTLKNDLSGDEGTIFRYHRHENTYLRYIYNQINSGLFGEIEDKDDLLIFIDSITNKKEGKTKICGCRDMVDQWELVAHYYYSPMSGGSTSLKKILPAAIHDSPFLKDKYSKPVCGIKMDEVTSLNFDSQIWIDPEYDNDPYKKLPPVFDGYSREKLDGMFSDMDEVADGGAAMAAYAKLQFFDTPEDQRESIKEALYKYCELDTLAMVMLWEFWNEQINNQFSLQDHVGSNKNHKAT